MNLFRKLFGRSAVTGSLEDKRDGREYATIRLGGRVWMAENLAYMPHVSPCHEQGGIWVYDYHGGDLNAARLSKRYREFGCLYDHATAGSMCPEGWSLPTEADCEQLLKSTGGSTYETRWSSFHSLRAGGDAGFNALLGGSRKVRSRGSEFSGCGRYGDWWTSDLGHRGLAGTLTEKSAALTFHMQLEDGGRCFVDGQPVDQGLSVRCVKR
jgi:uncharacterized protein (TIGR02145 family)